MRWKWYCAGGAVPGGKVAQSVSIISRNGGQINVTYVQFSKHVEQVRSRFMSLNV